MSSKLPLVDLNNDGPDAQIDEAAKPFSENLLRPRTFAEYVGQESVTKRLSVFMQAAKARGQSLDHVLLSGPPGLGKTTLAHLIALERGTRLHMAPGPSLERPADLMALLTHIDEGDVLFIDEIHRLTAVIEEALYPAMEDFQVQYMVQGQEPISLTLKRFTLVGATTQPGRLTAPLRDRFGIELQLNFYTDAEMSQILSRSAKILNIQLTDSELGIVAQRSRGTPRIGNRLLARVRDFVEVSGHAFKKDERVHKALEFLDVDHEGLQPLDRRYLKVLMDQFKGGPAGVEALAASLAEDRSTLEETLEPYLLKQGFIARTPRGRVACDRAYTHMGLRAPAQVVAPKTQQDLEF
jgi:Holliday junction DNA helicase RuvB